MPAPLRLSSWEPTALSVTRLLGTATSITIRFTSSEALSNARVVVVPALAPYVSIYPNSSFTEIPGGVSQSIIVRISLPKTTAPGTYQGTLHIETDRTVARPLPVALTVQRATDALPAPPLLADPSVDRITVTTDGNNIAYVKDEVDIFFNTGATSDTIRQVVRSIGGVFLGSAPQLQWYQVLVPTEGFDQLTALVNAAQSSPAVAFAIHNLISKSFVAPPNDPYMAGYYAPPLVNLQKAWDLTGGGSDTVEVGVIDGAFDFSQPDLMDHVAGVFPNLGDDEGHGTRVASVIGATANNHLGIAGVMWNKNLFLYPCGIPGILNPPSFQSGVSLSSQCLLDSVTDIASRGVKAVNYSRGVDCQFSDDTCAASLRDNDYWFGCLFAANRCSVVGWAVSPKVTNTLWVVAAGNGGIPLAQSSPARLAMFYDNIVSIGAVDSNSRRANFSDYGSGITVYAPGVNIDSDAPGGSCDNSASGTSVAAPFVTGTAGLMLAKNSSLSPSQIKSKIQATGNLTGENDPDNNPIRLLDGCRAVKAAMNQADPPVPVLLSPAKGAIIVPNASDPNDAIYAVFLNWADVSAASCNQVVRYDLQVRAGSSSKFFLQTSVAMPGYNLAISNPPSFSGWSWTVAAVDKFGNATQSAAGMFSLDRPPVAGLTMTAGSQAAIEGQTLNLTVAPGESVTVGFSANRSSDPDGTITAWQWTIDGANASTASSFTASLGKGVHPVTLVVTDNLGSRSAPAQGTVSISETLFQPGTFIFTQDMGIARANHTATLLPNGKILIVGGNNGSTAQSVLQSAQLYDPMSLALNPTGSLKTPRVDHTATLLPSGKVLIAGGYGNGLPLSTAEVYDVTTGTFTPTAGQMQAAPGQGSTATLLPNGKVLIAGGEDAAAVAQLYDPVTDTFSLTGGMVTGRFWHTATLLPNGKVLVTGGFRFLSPRTESSAELYDPNTGSFTTAGNMTTARELHTATLLPNGKVLIVGGLISAGYFFFLNSAEFYDPASGSFNVTQNMATARALHAAILLQNGSVLFATGETFCGTNGTGCAVSTPAAEIFNPVSNAFAATGNMNIARDGATATLLPSGNVLIIGGVASSPVRFLSSAELYIP